SIFTAMRISFDEGVTWQGPYLMSKSSGAYPSTVELKDKSVLMFFYEEGKGSGVGVFRFVKPANVLDHLIHTRLTYSETFRILNRFTEY
ncbi:MAG: sialidase family protein, partial [Mangrovibacterium sp.]|nr:sialidase family protein [Mangrovibacterium sp.]